MSLLNKKKSHAQVANDSLPPNEDAEGAVVNSKKKIASMFDRSYLQFNYERDESYTIWLLECESDFEPVISRESNVVPASIELQDAAEILDSETIPSDYVHTEQQSEEEDLVIL